VETPAASMEEHLVWETSILKDKWYKELFYFFASLDKAIQTYGSITNSEKSERGR
jgi:hypothetical protein